MKSMEIISDVRKQAALVKSYLEHLKTLRSVNAHQLGIIEQVRIGFNKIVAIEIAKLRHLYGDDNFCMFEDVDKCLLNTDSYSLSTKKIVEQIGTEAACLQMKITTLPGEDGAGDEQSHVLDKLQDALRDWRNFDYGLLKNAFGFKIV